MMLTMMSLTVFQRSEEQHGSVASFARSTRRKRNAMPIMFSILLPVVLLILQLIVIVVDGAMTPNPNPYMIEQSDGTFIEARMVGTAEDPEEEDKDGYTIVAGNGNSERTDYFYAKIDPKTDDLIPTNVRVNDRGRRPAYLQKHIRRGAKAKQRMKFMGSGPEGGPFVPVNSIIPDGGAITTGTGTGRRGGNGFQGRAGTSFGGRDNDIDGLGDGRALLRSTAAQSNHVRGAATSTITELEEEEDDLDNAAAAVGTIINHHHHRNMQEVTVPQRTNDGNSLWTGTTNMLIVLMRFSDHVGRNLPTPAQYEQFFNSEGPNDPLVTPSGSIKKMFKRASYDQLNLQATVTPVWITLPNTEQYYADDGRRGVTTRIHEAMKYALEYVVTNKLVKNWEDFDNGIAFEDGTSELVGFLHSGYASELGGNSNDGANFRDRIWTHNSYLHSFNYYPSDSPLSTQSTGTLSGFHVYNATYPQNFIRVSPYFVTSGVFGDSSLNEICRLGVVAHELGNLMGLPDLYDLDRGLGIGSWGFMGNPWGWQGNQKCVATLSPYSKLQMGWLNPNNITTIHSSGRVTIPASMFSSDGIVKINRGFPTDDEYLLVEYRTPTPNDTEFCLSLRGGGGLAIWHIDERSSQKMEGHPGQEGWPTNGNHYKIAVMQSDGNYDLEKNINNGDSTDLWRAGQTFGPSTRMSSTTPIYPNSDSYQNGVIQPTDIVIGNITQSPDGSNMSFDVSVPGGTLVSELRFSQKISFFNDTASQPFDTELKTNYLPLGPDDFPLVRPLGDLLKETKCGSVVLQDDYNVGTYDIGALTALAGGPPSHAGDADGINSDYWIYLEEVIDYQLHRRQAVNPTSRSSLRAMSDEGMPWLSLPDLWTDFTITEVAEAVHDEYPGLEQARLLAKIIKQGVKPDTDIIPRRCRVQFLKSIVLWSKLNTWSIDMVGPKNFAAKYYNGRARPEEGAWAVHCSLPTLTMEQMRKCDKSLRLDLSIIPQSVQDKVAQLNLTRMLDFGAYPEGAPTHPAWPAMHSAASVMSVWLPIVANITSDQIMDQVKKTDLAVAMARTVAGVHYYDDNIAGLKMGQYIIEKELPNYLKETYNADPEKVKAKINALHFDWEAEATRILGATPFASSAARRARA